MMGATGRAVLFVGTQLGLLVLLARDVVTRVFRVERREVVRHAFEVGNRSLFFVAVIMAFVGAIMVIQASTQALRVIGDLSTIGPAFLQLLIREFGPTIICMMVAARVGAGMAAEIGAMTITEQIDALRLNGAEPLSYLVAPRVLGGILGTLPVVVLGSLVAHGSGGLAATQLFGVAWETYLGTQLLGPGDVALGVAKTLSYGAAIPLVACQAGLAASGGAPGVGHATTRAVIVGSISVLGLDLVIGTLGYAIERAVL